VPAAVQIDHGCIAEFCHRWGVAELALFGSVLRDDFGPDSDVDVLVEFKPGTEIGLLAFSRMQRELASILGRPVDLVTKSGLKPRIREAVLSSAEVVFAAGRPARSRRLAPGPPAGRRHPP